LISDALDAKAVRDPLLGSNAGLFKVDWALERQVLESVLWRAIASQEPVLYYQPKIDLENGAIVGAVIWMGKNLGCRSLRGCRVPRPTRLPAGVVLRAQGQGYYSSEPLTAAEFTRLLRRTEAETASATSVM
jgi:sensor c-di-GMP phosphodiesterase-like protein